MGSSTPLRLAALQELAAQHYDIGVLTMMQNDVLFQSIEEMQLMGAQDPAPNQVLGRADMLLPKGMGLQQMYFRRYASLTSAPVEELESTSSSLTLCAKHLEAIAARSLTKDQPLPAVASAYQVIGQRYAQLIQAARTLEDHGVISVSHAHRLSKLSDRPIGPLAHFYDKAIALLEHHAPRARMAA